MKKNTLFVAVRLEGEGSTRWSPVGRLQYIDNTYRFVYTRGARSTPDFKPFSGMECLDTIYRSNELFPVFVNRMLTKSRPEYDAFLRWSGFDAASPPDPIAILGVTEGIRRTDMIELFPLPIPDEHGRYVNRFFLHGLRYMPPETRERVTTLKPGDQLYPEFEKLNGADPNAVALKTKTDNVLLGYVPRYLAQDFRKVMQSCKSDHMLLTVCRVNADAPLQQRLLCELDAFWPDGFKPCSGDEFLPIPDKPSSLFTTNSRSRPGIE